jgi:hypothetical protein
MFFIENVRTKFDIQSPVPKKPQNTLMTDFEDTYDEPQEGRRKIITNYVYVDEDEARAQVIQFIV